MLWFFRDLDILNLVTPPKKDTLPRTHIEMSYVVHYVDIPHIILYCSKCSHPKKIRRWNKSQFCIRHFNNTVIFRDERRCTTICCCFDMRWVKKPWVAFNSYKCHICAVENKPIHQIRRVALWRRFILSYFKTQTYCFSL